MFLVRVVITQQSNTEEVYPHLKAWHKMGSFPLLCDWARGGVFFINLGVSPRLQHESRNEVALLLIIGTRGRLKGVKYAAMVSGTMLIEFSVERKIWVSDRDSYEYFRLVVEFTQNLIQELACEAVTKR